MPPLLAHTLTLLFLFYLFKRDCAQGYRPSRALWIPSIWMLLLGSRSISYWLDPNNTFFASSSYLLADDIMEGSPIDRAGFFLLMILGLAVLFYRRISLSQVFANNIALVLFFLYCGITILWSDFPAIAFKRWSKAFGDPIMVLIILTDPEPIKAVEAVLKRCAYVLMPLSVLFIKYYPHLGRAYSENEGIVYYTGVAMNKNVLGFVCMTCGLFCIWRLCSQWGKERELRKWNDMITPVVLLLVIGWLFYMSDSKTPLLCLILSTAVIIGLGFTSVRKHLGGYTLATIFVFFILQFGLNIGETIILGAGRDPTLTGRTELWEILLRMAQNPLIGEGFESFWLGERLRKLWDMYYFKPNQAHSGYIETYLNLGLIGLCFLGGIIVSYYRKMRVMLRSSSQITVNFGRFGMGFLAAYLFYNITEAAFKELHLLFVIFLIFGIKYPQLRPQVTQSLMVRLPKGLLANSEKTAP